MDSEPLREGTNVVSGTVLRRDGGPRSFQAPGVVAEWLNAAVLKTAEPVRVP